MNEDKILELIFKYRESSHSEFDIYAPTKEERKAIMPILSDFENELGIEVRHWKLENGKVKGFTIKVK